MLRDEGLERMLRRVRRHAAPDVPLEFIFERLQRRRRRGWALGGLGAAGALLCAAILLSGHRGREAHVHLHLQMVDVSPADLIDQPPEDMSPQEAGP